MADETKTRTAEPPMTLDATLCAVGGGQLNLDGSEALREVVRACQDRASDAGKPAKGKVTLTIELEVAANGETKFKGSVDSKRPGPRKVEARLFVTKGGNLSDTDPRQDDLFKGRKGPAS